MIKHVLESSGQRVIRITQRERSPTTLKFRNPLTKKSSSNFAGISDHLRSDNDVGISLADSRCMGNFF